MCSSSGPDAAKKASLHQNNIATAAAVQESPMTEKAKEGRGGREQDAGDARDPFSPSPRGLEDGFLSVGGFIYWISFSSRMFILRKEV